LERGNRENRYSKGKKIGCPRMVSGLAEGILYRVCRCRDITMAEGLDRQKGAYLPEACLRQ